MKWKMKKRKCEMVLGDQKQEGPIEGDAFGFHEVVRRKIRLWISVS
jgi:hypothetical protein